jgi:hypothetical protein
MIRFLVVNLRTGIGHGQNMPLLTELGNLFSCGYYKHAGPTGLVPDGTLVTRHLPLVT